MQDREIITYDDDGKGIYSTGFGHGDSIHLGDLDPKRPGLEVFDIHEEKTSPYGLELREPFTGKVLWGVKTGNDVGRGLTGDVDPRHPGEECWANKTLFAADGTVIAKKSLPTVFALWWDADPLRELQDNNKIFKWDYTNNTQPVIFSAEGYEGMTGTRRTPILQADIFGDWREELVLRSPDSTSISIFTTTDVTDRRIYTLMHDPVYRLAVQREIICYNMPPHTGFYLGDGMDVPAKPSIYLVP